MKLTCEETFRLFQDYLDRELSQTEAERVQQHLDECGICSEEYVFEASVLRRVRTVLASVEVPEDLFEQVSASLDRAFPVP